MSDKDRLNFEYSIDEFTETELKVNIFFQNPTSVSTTNEKDQLILRLENFRDAEGKLIAEDQDIVSSLPNQLDPTTSLMVAQAGTAASSAVGAATSINLVLNFVKGASMSQMISSIKNLQVIVHLVLM